MTTPPSPVRAVVLAGGSGTRLWPMSRLHAPKQFLRLTGHETMLEATVNRLGPRIAPSDVLVVTSEALAKGEGFHQLEPYESLLEPVGRNTAPAIGVAAMRYRLEGIDPVMVVLPSDHLVTNVPAFQRVLAAAIDAAEDGRLVTFGITPTEPATGYGYVKAPANHGNVRPVERFKEKPDVETARAMLAEGGYFWNSGMFVWKASAILDAIRRTQPKLSALLDLMQKEAGSIAGLAAVVKKRLPEAESISIDHGVLETCGNLYLLPGDFGWSDIGSWDAIHDVSEKDADSNASQGNVVAIDCRNTLIRSETRLVAAVGLDDVTVIETSDAVLVTKRGEGQRVRSIVDELIRRSATEHITHTKVNRPWGSYTVLEEGPGFKIKRIEVRPGGRLSLQSHEHRSEHWVVVSGAATVTCDAKVSTLNPNESTYIPIGTKHRLENLGDVPLQIIEVQVGVYVGEDDIKRYDDQYGR
ncbi:Alginate biosynthesis protein AlgA [Usitatibacter rugosus]|uniref:mannose-1-phosphate guanylyltransferase n=2 Tax=Usitatibacter rugosus TaxID=2732067 RepID=A0A6M4GWT7_9PROT|nr:mannose-1-phosphate guanylyltransferase/mannose-6-phosphate isomerase [Usitatibacter rugosus]QJR11696.1 Alginate biosynthesis protein AlgA [Usitatibacter rugosus]